MNRKAYQLFIIVVSITQWHNTRSSSSTTPSSSSYAADRQTTPWTPTFAGINAQPVTTPSTTGPFQQTLLPSTLQTPTNNPFYTPASGLSSQTTQTTAQTITALLANPTTPFNQKINAAFNPNTCINGNPLKITAKTKHLTTPAAQAMSNLTGISFTQANNALQKPTQPLFPTNPTLAVAYENFMNAMQQVPHFLPLFKKLHIIALHEIYTYLMGIYTSLTMTHIDDVKTYMLTEKKYALNKKTLIIHHLVNVIMAQLNQALQALMPGMPESHAISTGMLCVQNDKLSDPNLFVLDLEKSVLAVIGLEGVSAMQVAAAYLALTQYSNLNPVKNFPTLITVTANSTLATAITKLKTVTPFSAKNFSSEERTALVQALDTINAYQINQKTGQDLQAIITNLTNPSVATITTQQVAQLKKLLGQFTYGQPLEEEISTCKTFAQLLGNGTGTVSSTPLTATQINTLKGILSFLLQQYEQSSTKQLTQIIQTLGEMNPSYQRLSPSQSLALKTIALQLLPSTQGKKPALLLENLSDTQRQNLAYGLYVTSFTSPNFSPAAQQVLQSLAVLLKQAPLSQSSLTTHATNGIPAQTQVLQQALTTLAGYQLPPLTVADFSTQAKKGLATLSLSTQDQEADITNALTIISSPKFTSFDQLTQEEQIILLQLFQNMDQIFETRLQNHLKQSTQLQYLFSQSPAAQQALFTSLTAAHYETLNAIDALLETAQGPVSFSDLIQVTPPEPIDPTNKKAWMDPTQALLKLFTSPVTKNSSPAASSVVSGNPFGNNNSYYSLLVQLQTQNFQDPALLEVLPTISPADIKLYNTALSILNSPNFTCAQLTTVTRNSLAQTLMSYANTLKKDRTTFPKTRIRTQDPNQSALELVANVLRFTDQYSSMKQSFLWVLKQYLVFFNLYAQTLQNVSTNAENPTYAGLTEFADYAQAIQQNLQYESGSKQAMLQLLEQTNPPLFFYNAAVFRGIQLLPKLALLVENSQVAPFPTFGIEQAIVGSSIDPLTNKLVSNQVTIDQNFTYNKFFFLQAPDATTELVGIQPSWISKIAVPSSANTPSSLYEPNNIPQDGITGFYMNIPSFQPNPTDSNTPLLRLFEQPIIAQPTWLNKAGTGAGVPKSGAIPTSSAGVITVLRGCLGDFQAILDLGIFDPCMTIIFQSALNIPDNGIEPVANRTPFTKQDTAACAAYIQQKEALLAKQNSAADSSSAQQQPTVTMPGTTS